MRTLPPLLVLLLFSCTNESFEPIMAEKNNCHYCQIIILNKILEFSDYNSPYRFHYENIISRACTDFLSLPNCESFRSDFHHFAIFLLQHRGAKWACQLGGYCTENRTEAFGEMSKLLGVFFHKNRTTKMFDDCYDCLLFIQKINRNFYAVEKLVHIAIQRCNDDEACLETMDLLIPIFGAIKASLIDSFEYCSLLQECEMM